MRGLGRQLGHSSIVTTQRYARISDEMVRRDADYDCASVGEQVRSTRFGELDEGAQAGLGYCWHLDLELKHPRE